MNKKVLLNIGESVRLDCNDYGRTFTIIDSGDNAPGKWYKQGGSAICFDAYYVDGDELNHYGKLKKFYLSDEEKDFEKEAEDYISSYVRLREIVSKSEGKSSLYSFVPEFEIYYDEDKCPYIWTNNVPMKTFGEICNQLIISEVRVEDALYEIITTLKSVTDCVRILHENNLIHGDINPDNFGFHMRDGRILADAVSMFDLNTLRYIWQPAKWFTSPYYDEIRGEDLLLNRADIRALGVTLCKSIGLNDVQIEEIKHIREKYNSRNTKIAIETIVRESRMFSYMSVPMDNRIIGSIVGIIMETVTTVQSKIVSSCTKLNQHLQFLETLLLPYCTKDELGRGLGIEIVNKEARRKDRIHEVFQYLLYSRPLYNWQIGNEEDIYGVVIVGFGLDSQSFLDVVLETTQSMNQKIHVDIWGTQRIKSEREFYLKERPALSQFYLIDNNRDKLTGDEYGNIEFHVRENLPLLDEVSKIMSGSECTRYVYIAAGNDTENTNIAKAFSEIVADRNISINAQCELWKKDEGDIHYVHAEMDVKGNLDFADIERMSFNNHLVWSGSLNADIGAKRKEYEADYYHASCLSNVLSIKYKLHYLKIDFNEGVYKAANEFMGRFPEDSLTRKRMIAAEHRRWVTEKICDGWISMRVEDSLQYNDTKDVLGKRHVCIVRSNEDFGLLGKWTNHSTWDNAEESEIKTLDELDAISVRLHQAYRKYSNTDNLDSIFAEKIDDYTMSLADGMEHFQEVFIEWIECLRELYNIFLVHEQDSGREEWTISEYNMLHSRLIKELDEECKEDELKKQAIKEKIAIINNAFQPVARCLKYHDYKKNDTDLINNIPFILSYSDDIDMVVPVEYGVLTANWNDVKPSQLFSYVAAATVVNPKELYLPCIVPVKEKKAISELIEQKIDCFNDYFKRKRLQTTVRLVKCNNRMPVEEIVDDKETSRLLFVEDNHNDVVIYGDNETTRKVFPYSFDMINITFDPKSGAKWMNSIRRNVGISARDVAAFLGREAKVGIQPSLRRIDNRILFGIYKSNRVAWRNLCAKLKKSENKNNSVMRFAKVAHDTTSENEEKRIYIIPYTCFKSANEILTLFKHHNIVSSKSCIYRYSIDACKIILFENSGCEEVLRKVFSKHDILSSGYSFNLIEDDDKYVLRCDSLSIENIKFNFSQDEQGEGMLSILKELQNAGLISFKQKKESFDITYGSSQIKYLFMEEGNMLEVYTYYKSKELNSFDDVVTGIKFIRPGNKNNKDDGNEIDCFVTKGFQTLVIECKARSLKRGENSEELLMSFKKKLFQEVKKYAINGRGLLVIDSETGIPSVDDFDNVSVCSNFNKIINIGQVVSAQIKEYSSIR